VRIEPRHGLIEDIRESRMRLAVRSKVWPMFAAGHAQGPCDRGRAEEQWNEETFD
jgi:hypothetical protein